MKPHKIYSNSIEGVALNQFFDAMKQEHTIKGALMPDAHCGYTLPIGAVIATSGIVFPSYVGFDIGCGVCSVKTSLTREDIDRGSVLRDIHSSIKEVIPLGYNHHKTARFWTMPDVTPMSRSIFDEKSGFKQLGTLGGGNHFIEVGYDEDGAVWFTIHSGSRGVGHGIATAYMKLASNSDKAKEGHYGLDAEGTSGRSYLKDMLFAEAFALENRRRMMNHLSNVIKDITGVSRIMSQTFINRNHNHAEVIRHDCIRKPLVIHRKGATHAEAGMPGVIPGSMRDGVFITVGKGCEESLFSSSHGAGRVLGRKAAKKALDVAEFEREMKGVVCDRETDKNIDESPMAYKNIFEVMENQKDLCEIVHHVKPLINVKG